RTTDDRSPNRSNGGRGPGAGSRREGQRCSGRGSRTIRLLAATGGSVCPTTAAEVHRRRDRTRGRNRRGAGAKGAAPDAALGRRGIPRAIGRVESRKEKQQHERARD